MAPPHLDVRVIALTFAVKAELACHFLTLACHYLTLLLPALLPPLFPLLHLQRRQHHLLPPLLLLQPPLL